MAVTLAEIAALAGVSRGTVDRALNDRGRVDPKVAARVRRIAAERGYRPNRAGRMLARAKNPIRIGVIVQSVETMFMHTVFEEIERASAHFTTTGAEVLVRPLEGVDAQQQLDVIDELLEAGVQGIALSPAEDERVRARIQELSERMPVVTFNSDLPDSGRLCYVGVDNFCLLYTSQASSGHPFARGQAGLRPSSGRCRSRRRSRTRTRSSPSDRAACWSR